MATRFFLLFVLLLGKLSVCQSQSFYEIKWESDKIGYTALIIYYDMNDITVRVKYKNYQNVYKVAEYKCIGEYKTASDGTRQFTYDGRDSKIVYSSDPADKSGYNADNFIFTNLNASNQFEKLYTIDDAQWGLSNYKDYMMEATFKKIEPAKDFTFKYLKDFFEEDELLYKTLVKNYLESRTDNAGSFRISSLYNSGSRWTVVMSKGTKYQAQSWKTGKEFPQDWVKEKWDINFRITSVAYGGGDWAVTMSEGSGIAEQTYMPPVLAYPEDWIKKKWDEGYRITSLGHGTDGWVVVMSKGTAIAEQTYMPPSYTFPEDWIKKKWDDSYRITSVAYGGDGWAVAMSKGTEIGAQTYMPPTYTYPEEWIKEKWAEDYDITSLAYGNSGWTVVMSKGFSYTQTYQASDTYPSSWIEGKWNGVNNTAVDDNKSSTIYLLTVAATSDPSIGISCRNDMDNMTNLITKIGMELNITVKTIPLSGYQVTKANIQNTINGLSLTPNDVVFFYYSGHGYNENYKTSDFPYMYLEGGGYRLEDAYSLIKSKQPRLTLVIGDLCNSTPKSREGTNRGGEIAFRSSPEFDYNKLSRLFVKAKGSLISTSSSYSEWSYSLPDGNGDGAFTKSFVASFLKETSVVSGSPGDWDNIFTSSYSATLYNTSHMQNQNGRYGQHGFNNGTITY